MELIYGRCSDSVGVRSGGNHLRPNNTLAMANMNTLEVPPSRISRRRHSEEVPRRISGISSTLLVDDRERQRKQRRLSLQTPEEKRRANGAGHGGADRLKAPNSRMVRGVVGEGEETDGKQRNFHHFRYVANICVLSGFFG